jgi:hypothetical protein
MLTVAGLLHERHDLSANLKDADEIHLDDLAPSVGVKLEHGSAGAGETRVVDQNVDRPACRGELRDAPRD